MVPPVTLDDAKKLWDALGPESGWADRQIEQRSDDRYSVTARWHAGDPAKAPEHAELWILKCELDASVEDLGEGSVRFS
jgi:hypothetical protein